MKFLTLVSMMFLFSGPTPEMIAPLHFGLCFNGGLSGIDYQIRSDSTIVYRRHDEQFRGNLMLGGWWKYSNATLEWKKTDETVTTYQLDTIEYLAYLIPRASNDEYVRLREQIATCIKEGPMMKEMSSFEFKGTPEEKRASMRRIQHSDARNCVCDTNVLVEAVRNEHIEYDFDDRQPVRMPKPVKKKKR